MFYSNRVCKKFECCILMNKREDVGYSEVSESNTNFLLDKYNVIIYMFYIKTI